MKPKLSLNNQHDYITLRTPNGNFTTSWNGARASGKLALHPTAFKNIDKYVQGESKELKKFKNVGEIMESLTNPEVLSKLWPEWDEPVEFNLFLPTNKVVFNHPLMIKKYPKGGVVTSVKKKNVYIRLTDTNEVIGFDYQLLTKI